MELLLEKTDVNPFMIIFIGFSQQKHVTPRPLFKSPHWWTSEKHISLGKVWHDGKNPLYYMTEIVREWKHVVRCWSRGSLSSHRVKAATNICHYITRLQWSIYTLLVFIQSWCAIPDSYLLSKIADLQLIPKVWDHTYCSKFLKKSPFSKAAFIWSKCSKKTIMLYFITVYVISDFWNQLYVWNFRQQGIYILYVRVLWKIHQHLCWDWSILDTFHTFTGPF